MMTSGLELSLGSPKFSFASPVQETLQHDKSSDAASSMNLSDTNYEDTISDKQDHIVSDISNKQDRGSQLKQLIKEGKLTCGELADIIEKSRDKIQLHLSNSDKQDHEGKVDISFNTSSHEIQREDVSASSDKQGQTLHETILAKIKDSHRKQARESFRGHFRP